MRFSSAWRKLAFGVVALALASCMGSGGVEGTSSEVVSTDMTVYTVGNNVIVSWTGLDGATDDWISIGVPGGNGGVYSYWVYTGGGVNGSVTFTGVAAGTWEARAYNSWSLTLSSIPIYRSPSFTVNPGGPASISTDATSYAPSAPITVTWMNFPGTAYDWVAIATAGSSLSSYWSWKYTGSASSGSTVFSISLPPGTYVARGFRDNTITLVAESPTFTVTGSSSTLLSIATSPTAGVGFSVSYTGMPGSATDWVSVANAGYPDNLNIEEHYTGGATNGSIAFAGLPVGNYEARAYYNYPAGGYTVQARLPFSVVPSHFSVLGGLARTGAYSISGNGLVVAGFGDTGGGTTRHAAEWSASTPGTINDISGGADTIGYGTNSDGSVVVGLATTPSIHGFVWTSSGGMGSVGDLPGGSTFSIANGVSGNGTTAVGYSYSMNGQEAFSWTSGGGIVGLGDLTGGTFNSEALGASSDGSIIVGYGYDATGRQAFRWTSGGMVGIGELAGGTYDSIAYNISSDGSTIVGMSNSSNGNEAFRYTATGGMVGLGDLPGGSFSSFAFSASSDGSVVVGVGSAASGNSPFVWDATNGMRDLTSVLTTLGVDLTGYSLDTAWSVSGDGKTIVGIGYDPSGTRIGWIARL